MSNNNLYFVKHNVDPEKCEAIIYEYTPEGRPVAAVKRAAAGVRDLMIHPQRDTRQGTARYYTPVKEAGIYAGASWQRVVNVCTFKRYCRVNKLTQEVRRVCP